MNTFLFRCSFASIWLLSKLEAFLLFAVEEQTGQKFAVEPFANATLWDLQSEIAKIKGVLVDQVEISFQGQKLTDLDAPLADLGMCNECTLSVAFNTAITLKYVDDALARTAGDVKFHGLDVLHWDTARDIAQFPWVRDMKLVLITFHDLWDNYLKGVMYKGYEERITASHSFFVIPCEQAPSDEVDQLPIGCSMMVESHHLKTRQFAKDIMIRPAWGQKMALRYVSMNERRGSYRFPDGYGLLLRHVRPNATH